MQSKSISDLMIQNKDSIQYYGSFKYSLHSHSELLNKNENNNIRTINFPMIKYWHRINLSHPDITYNLVFSQVYGELLENDHLLEYVYNAILILYKHLDNIDEVTRNVFKSRLCDPKIKLVINDQIMGIGNQSGLSYWYQMFKKYSNNQVSSLSFNKLRIMQQI